MTHISVGSEAGWGTMDLIEENNILFETKIKNFNIFCKSIILYFCVSTVCVTCFSVIIIINFFKKIGPYFDIFLRT